MAHKRSEVPELHFSGVVTVFFDFSLEKKIRKQ